MKDYILLDEKEREELRKAFEIIKNVKDKISDDYEEDSCINTTLYYLDIAINYKKKMLY